MTARPDDAVATPTTDANRRATRPLSPQEAEEFANVLGVRPEIIATRDGANLCHELDALESYDQLVADPIKSRFAKDVSYYHKVRADIVRETVSSVFGSVSAPSLRVVDVGCGPGTTMRLLEPHFGHVSGCDPAISMVCRAGPSARHMPTPTRLPFDNDAFDVAICTCIYHHIDPAMRVEHLAEVRRVLRYGGMLFVFEHNPRNPVTRLIVHRCKIDEAAVLVDSSDMGRLMQEAGYHNVRNRFYLFFPQFIYDRLRKLEKYLSWTRLGGQYCTMGRNIVRCPVRQPQRCRRTEFRLPAVVPAL